MSAKHEWLNLLEVSGPFLAIPVLREVFPQGLEELDSARARRLRSAYEEWRDAVDGDDAAVDALHGAWIDEVLRTALEADDQLLKTGTAVPAATVELPEHGATITAERVLVDPTHGGAVLAPIHVFPPDTDLLASRKFDGLSCSAGDRMALHLRALNLPFGLVTNGERWMLVHAPSGQVATFASWYARLWGQEPETLRAFASLLGVRLFFAPEQDRLPALFERSTKHQDEVTDALGDQVRRAIQVLVQALDRADQDRNRELLRDVKPQDLYEAGLTVMMRLVFLLAAEERGLLLLGEPRYDSFYAVSTLRMQLRAESDEILERRRSAWSRLLAVFRAVFGGIDHPTLRLPAMGGSLFDPDRFPFLEGRLKGTSWRHHRAEPLPIDDRTVLLLLEAIQTFEGRTLSYRALDVEQIGHVYEGLLERTVQRVEDVTLELEAGAQAKDARVTLGEIESARLDGDEPVERLLVERSKRSKSAVSKALAAAVESQQSARLLSACRGDVTLRTRLEPYVRLLRTDPWGYPLVHPKGAFVVVLGTDRRETGAHYTPKYLAERVVEETLAPLVYDGPASGAPRSEWKLKTPESLLDLKVCDPAMGSGAFLVQVCRFLSARLVESWAIEEAAGRIVDLTGKTLGPDASVETLSPGDEVRAEHARRIVAERCLYGVDVNPLAVELAKLSLWLVTLSKGRPFGFLDHNLRCGDSVIGVGRLEQLVSLSLEPAKTRQIHLFGDVVHAAVGSAVGLRRKIREVAVRDIQDVEIMGEFESAARRKLEVVDLLSDAFVGIVCTSKTRHATETGLASLGIQFESVARGDSRTLAALRSSADADLNIGSSVLRPFHWPLAFPEVTHVQGFDAAIGNPPWVSYAGRMAQPLEARARSYYLNSFNSFKGFRNLQGLFIERVGAIVKPGGRVGLVVPSSMSEQAGYAPVRAVHDEFAICDPGLPNLPENIFPKVNQPSMILFSTVRASRLAVGSAAPWPMDRPDLDVVALSVLEKLASEPLPSGLFGERGLQTSGRDVDYLADAPDAEHNVPLRTGGDIQAFRLGLPSQHASQGWFGDRLRDVAEWRQVSVLIRQTSRVPIATCSDGIGFRNSILAGFESGDYSRYFLVAYLNSTPIRWRHYFLHRDARYGTPQMKIGHLRGIPAPPTRVVADLEELGRAYTDRNQGVTPNEQCQIDRIVGAGFDLSSEELRRMWADSVRWS